MFTKLQNCRLFAGLNEAELKDLLGKITYQLRKYSYGDMIAQTGNEVISQKIVVEGSVKGEMVDFNGRTIKIEDIEGPRSLAPAFLFGSENQYPVNIVANNDVLIILIPRQDFLKMLQSSQKVLHNYLDIISNRTQFLSAKLKLLSFQSIKGKLAQYLLSLSKQANSDSIILPVTHSELAELFGVARPSLSRALSEMNSEGIIRAKGRSVYLLDKKALSVYLR